MRDLSNRPSHTKSVAVIACISGDTCSRKCLLNARGNNDRNKNKSRMVRVLKTECENVYSLSSSSTKFRINYSIIKRQQGEKKER